jgi:hypothetical protein
LRRRRIREAGLYRVAAKRIDEALHKIQEVVLVDLSGDPNSEKHRRAAFVDPIREMLDVEAVLDERCGSGAASRGSRKRTSACIFCNICSGLLP